MPRPVVIPEIVSEIRRPGMRERVRGSSWYKITSGLAVKDENGGGTQAEVMIYDEIGGWGITAADFVRELADLNVDRILLRINSPGGDVFDGLAIYNSLVSHRAQVEARVEGLAASAASFVAMAGDRVTVEKRSQMMIHDAFGFAMGNAADMRSLADVLDSISDQIAGIYADRAGGEESAWRTAMKAETWYTGPEARDAGLADEVAGEPKAEPAAAASWDLSIFTYSGRDRAPDPVPILPVTIAPPARPGIDFAALAETLRGATS